MRRRRLWSREAWALIGVAAVTLGCSVTRGNYIHDPSGLVILVVGILCLLAGQGARTGPAGRWLWCLAIAAGAISMGFTFALSLKDWLAFCGLGVLGVGVALWQQRSARIVLATAIAAVELKLMVAEWHWGSAEIDVFHFIQSSTKAFIAGTDPYAHLFRTTTPNIPLAHFLYLPGVLLLATPFRLLGDIRVLDLVAGLVLVASVVVLAKRHGGEDRAWLCGTLMVVSPFLPKVILSAWPEIVGIAVIALWLAIRVKHPVVSAIGLGIGLTTVPTSWPVLVIPALREKLVRYELLLAIAVGLLLCLPFALWIGVETLWKDVVLIQLHASPRADGLDLESLWWRITGHWWSGLVFPVGSFLALLFIYSRSQRNWESIMYASALWLSVTFLLSKWAFINYYFLAAMGLILAIALVPTARAASQPETNPPAVGPELSGESLAS